MILLFCLLLFIITIIHRKEIGKTNLFSTRKNIERLEKVELTEEEEDDDDEDESEVGSDSDGMEISER